VKIYTCGVTVYDESHIGHARSLYIFDLIRSYLKYRQFKIKFVRNITDIDDKIINRANELKTDWKLLVNKYIDLYYRDLKELGIEKGDFEPRATENIKDMIKYITGLIDKGYAYESGGDVYFDVKKFDRYGRLSGQNIEQMESGARIEPTETKKDPLDFALWKKSKENEPSWKSPWGEGRPGWHIECSVMSQKFLKTDTLDIHAGGRDLIFPHHENEIAQAEGLTGKPFAKYWIHHGLLTINGQKMSKSLGNFVTIKDFMKRYDADVLKLFFLQTHYSHPIDFTWKSIEEKHKALYDIIQVLKYIRLREEGEEFTTTDLKKKISPEELYQKIEELRGDFEKAMDDDFNAPSGVAVLFEIKRECEKVLFDVSYTKKHLKGLTYARKTIEEFGDIFGISFQEGPLSIPRQRIELKIKTRNKLREQKDFKGADKVRKELERDGIILKDTKDGKTIWDRKI